MQKELEKEKLEHRILVEVKRKVLRGKQCYGIMHLINQNLLKWKFIFHDVLFAIQFFQAGTSDTLGNASVQMYISIGLTAHK